MSNEEGTSVPESQSPEAAASELSSQDVNRLTSYKWRYALESHGFSADQASHLLFMKWLYGNGGVRS